MSQIIDYEETGRRCLAEQREVAQTAFFGGVIIGDGGICDTLAAAWLRGERPGDR